MPHKKKTFLEAKNKGEMLEKITHLCHSFECYYNFIAFPLKRNENAGLILGRYMKKMRHFCFHIIYIFLHALF